MITPYEPAPRRVVTADELLTLPDDDLVHELVRGEHRVNPPPGPRHGQTVTAIAALLAAHVRAHALGVVFGGNTGFVLARDPDTVRGPDVSFVRRERIPPGGVGDRYIDGAPDLAVEVVSPGDAVAEVEQKVGEYLAAGARLVWVVDPRLARVAVHAPGAVARMLGTDDQVDGGDVLPGFACTVRELVTWPL